jgi:CheY-like chemotaxis protein
MDGPTATRTIRNELQYDGPVLGVTGNGQEFDVAHFKESGCNEVFTKPLNVAAFKETMAAIRTSSKRS